MTTYARILRGYKALELKRYLATEELTQTQLAEMFGCSQPEISKFNTAHKAEIAEIRANLEDEFAGLWVAKKQNRLAEYEDLLARAKQEDLDADPQAMKVAATILRQVAEEVGQLPTRMKVDHGEAVVRHEVVGVNPADLT